MDLVGGNKKAHSRHFLGGESKHSEQQGSEDKADGGSKSPLDR